MTSMISPQEISELPHDSVGELAEAILRSAPEAGPWPTAPVKDETADSYFNRLVEAERCEEAIQFAAVRLGPRRAVWWGSLCAWRRSQSQGDQACETALAAIDAAVAWSLETSEENRQAANAAAHAAGVTTAAGALAAAAFWACGSVSLPGRPEVPAPAGVAAKLVANSVVMAAADPSAPVRRQWLMQALRMAAEVFAGQTPWSKPVAEEVTA